MENETIIIILVVCICLILIGVVVAAVLFYFCCGPRSKRNKNRNQNLPAATTDSSQSIGSQQELTPKPLPKVGSSSLWMSKPYMQAAGPNDAYSGLKNGTRKNPVLMRDILSMPNVSNDNGRYVYEGNLRMYHSQQIPDIINNYPESRAYYNDGFILSNAGFPSRNVGLLKTSDAYPTEYGTDYEPNKPVLRRFSHRLPEEAPYIPPREFPYENAALSGQSNELCSSHRKNNVSRSFSIKSEQSKSSFKNKNNNQKDNPRLAESTTSTLISEHNSSELLFPHSQSALNSNDDLSIHAKINPLLDLELEPDYPEGGSIPENSVDEQSYIESVSDATESETKGQKVTTQAFEFLDNYLSDDDAEKQKEAISQKVTTQAFEFLDNYLSDDDTEKQKDNISEFSR
ncbi:uncharacterized protein LOC115209825 [Argonauta hians]